MSQVLIAEDETMLRMIAVELLQDAGFTVFEAGDGEEALRILRANPGIQVLVSDIKMPYMDGYTLAVAGVTMRPELKVLLMTGYAQNPPPALLKAREVKTLHKPFNLERLSEMVGEMLARP
jgi:DNA-binding NtrC family response regulator